MKHIKEKRALHSYFFLKKKGNGIITHGSEKGKRKKSGRKKRKKVEQREKDEKEKGKKKIKRK